MYWLGMAVALGGAAMLIGQPVVTTLLTALVIDEFPGFWQIMGGAICIGGILIVQRDTSRARQEPLQLDA